VRCYTWGGEGRQKRAERSGFALTFFVSFLGQAKKEKDRTGNGWKNRVLYMLTLMT